MRAVAARVDENVVCFKRMSLRLRGGTKPIRNTSGTVLYSTAALYGATANVDPGSWSISFLSRTVRFDFTVEASQGVDS